MSLEGVSPTSIQQPQDQAIGQALHVWLETYRWDMLFLAGKSLCSMLFQNFLVKGYCSSPPPHAHYIITILHVECIFIFEGKSSVLPLPPPRNFVALR